VYGNGRIEAGGAARYGGAVEPDREHHHPDPGIRAILSEIRDLRVEMRRVDEERRVADAAWRAEQARRDEEHRLANAAFLAEQKQAREAWLDERRLADTAWRQERRQAHAELEDILADSRADSARRDAGIQQVLTDIHTVGTAIVSALNRHTRILEHHGRLLGSIDRKLGARRNGPPRGRNGRSA
jgi:hypothetical protein